MRSWCQIANEKLMSNGQWEANVKWPMRSKCRMANEKQMSFGQWEANVIWPMRSWCQIANEKLMSNNQWEAGVKWPERSWCQLANEKLISDGKSAYFIWPKRSLCHNLFYCLSICWHLEIMSVFITSIKTAYVLIVSNLILEFPAWVSFVSNLI